MARQNNFNCANDVFTVVYGVSGDDIVNVKGLSTFYAEGASPCIRT